MKTPLLNRILGWCGLIACATGAVAAEPSVKPTDRGAVVETDRYRAEFRDGVLSGFLNKLTAEEYVRQDVKATELIPHLPTGLATQATDEEREAAAKLFEHYWWEHAPTSTWPNQHFPTAASDFACVVNDDGTAELTYRGLSNGTQQFPDESFVLRLGVDPEHGDLLVTPAASAPRGGVYGAGLSLLTLDPEVTVEAPIFDGIQLDRHQQPMLWQQMWANYWDYGFVALNGKNRGAVGLWCQDAELKTPKALFYLVKPQGLSLAVQAMNIPSFAEQKDAAPMTWRLQAFDKSWSQAAKRFRDWKQKHEKIAPRPAWVSKIWFLYYGGAKAGAERIAHLEKYFDGQHLDRTLTWFADVRAAGFDKNHSNNTPYDGFRAAMQEWNAKQTKNMTYLQPMIMWGPDPKTDRERKAVEFSREAMHRQAFLAETGQVTPQSQHNLGSPAWQRWFLDWVREYIQDYGTTGIYHDQSYACFLDVRGTAAPGGMTTTQGMADYFFKAATENPGSIHGTEHLTEVNSVGASVGLGSGIIWGTPGYQGKIGPVGSMNWQRIKKASPVSNALHAPNSRILGFPHQSDYATYGLVRFHEGMDMMEHRGDMPALDMGVYMYWLGKIPCDRYANEMWLDRTRALAFVRHGLTPDFPEDWDRQVLTYFRGLNGEDFRYEKAPGGSAFVQVNGDARRLVYARVNGLARADVPSGGIFGWPCYDERGVAGLNPDESITYVIDGGLPRPAAWFELPGDDLCVADGYAGGELAFLQLQPVAGREPTTRRIVLHAPTAPKAVWVDGKAVTPAADGAQRWAMPVTASSCVVVLMADPPTDLSPLVLTRMTDPISKRDVLHPSALADSVKADKAGLRMNPFNPFFKDSTQTHLAVRAPAAGDGVLRVIAQVTIGNEKNAAPRCRLNGQPVAFAAQEKPEAQILEIPLKANEPAVLSFDPVPSGVLALEWKAP